MEKTYYFSKYPTGYLIALIEQTDNKITLLKAKNIEKKSLLVYRRIEYLKVLATLMKNCLTERYLNENHTLTEYGKMLLNAKREIEKDILKDVFTTVLIKNKGLIALSFYEKVISKLDIDHLQKIIDSEKDSIYGMYAKERFDELLFMVDEETKRELKQKIINDGGRF